MNLIKTFLITWTLVLFSACGSDSSATPIPVDIEATVEARVKQEVSKIPSPIPTTPSISSTDVEKAVATAVAKAISGSITSTPTPTPTPLPTPTPTPTPVPPTPTTPMPTPTTPMPTPMPTPTPVLPTPIPLTSTPMPVEMFDTESVATIGVKSVVKIRSDKGWGSGFIISSDGLAVTNQHVIDGSELITVYLHDGTVVDAYVLDQNESVDLALIKIEKKDLDYLEFGNSASLSLGQKIIIIGYPEATKLRGSSTVTQGIISAKNRSFGSDENLLQTDGAIHSGNSGGPWLDLNTKVIGISRSKLRDAQQGLNFGIPSAKAKPIIQTWIENFNNGNYIKPTPSSSPSEIAYQSRSEGRKQYDAKDYSGAIESYTKAIQISPRAMDYYRRSKAYYYSGFYEKALNDINQTIALDPFPTAYNVRGLIHYTLGLYQEALDDFTKDLELEENEQYRKSIFKNRGMTYYKLELYQEAVRDYTMSIELSPDYIKAYSRRVYAYYKLGLYEKSILDCMKVIQLDPDNNENLNEDAYKWLGFSRYKLGQYQEALNNFNKALDLNPKLETDTLRVWINNAKYYLSK